MMINVKINNNSQFINDESNIELMVEDLKIETNGIAIAVNETVISRSNWKGKQLKENDNITIIKATQGG